MTDSPPEDITLDYDVVVVGAGLAGLTAAVELQSRCPEIRVCFSNYCQVETFRFSSLKPKIVVEGDC